MKRIEFTVSFFSRCVVHFICESSDEATPPPAETFDLRNQCDMSSTSLFDDTYLDEEGDGYED